MIGLAGWVETGGSVTPSEVLERMLRAMAHRGPGSGVLRAQGVALGWVGAGEEAPPTGDLLRIEGWMHPRPSGADGLAHALEKARGEFVALAWEGSRRRLTLARDPLGVRPVYVVAWEGGLAFGSEIKAVLHHPRARRSLDAACLPELLAYRYVAGGRTVLQGVRELLPGHVLVWQDGRLEERVYWDLPYRMERAGQAAGTWEARAEKALEEATAEAVRASDRTGTLLSGGLDSSLVTEMFVRGRPGPLRSWSAGSPDPRLDESERASFVARVLGTRHESRPVSGEEYARALPEAIAANDEPLHHPNAVALLLLARDAAREVDALLMGEGADSSFGNRAALKMNLALTLRRALPGPARRVALELAARAGVRHAGALRDLCQADPDAFALSSNQFEAEAIARALAGGASRQAMLGDRGGLIAGGALDPIGRLLRYYQRTELLASFNVFGKMLAAAGVEARMPFGSRTVQEVTCRIPSSRKVSLGGTAKPLLVRIARRRLPSEVVVWPKMSFGYPMAAWMRRGGPLAPYVSLLERPDARTREVLDRTVLRRVIEENEQGLGNHGEGALFVAVNLEIWFRVLVEGTAPAAVAEEARAEAVRS